MQLRVIFILVEVTDLCLQHAFKLLFVINLGSLRSRSVLRIDSQPFDSVDVARAAGGGQARCALKCNRVVLPLVVLPVVYP